MLFRVIAPPSSPSGWFSGAGVEGPCALGAGGVAPAATKREGDGCTPGGVWPLRRVFYRPDRLAAPDTALPVTALTPDDLWCDAPADRLYNRLVKRPYPASAERMWREDQVYDLVVALGYNDAPVVAGAGSCIFWHLARSDLGPTRGCVAVARSFLLAALAAAKQGDALEIAT
jgi:L,D-peptidoglycan transpeptidase YkuD (ErfK/YbiS/YcfS/YnhG family)